MIIIIFIIFIVIVVIIIIIIITIEGNANWYNGNMYIQKRVLRRYTSNRTSYIFQDLWDLNYCSVIVFDITETVQCHCYKAEWPQ